MWVIGTSPLDPVTVQPHVCSVLAARQSAVRGALISAPWGASVICGESMILHPIPGSLVPDVEFDGTQAQRRSRALAGGGPDGLRVPVAGRGAC